MPPRDKLQSGTVHGVELPKEDQCFAKSLGVRGGNVRKLAPSNMCVPKNVVEVQLEDGSTTLCMIPSKFNKKVWIKVGGMLIINRPVPLDGDAKITSNVISVLSPKDLKILNKLGVVPLVSQQPSQQQEVYDEDNHSSGEIPPNPNHRNAVQYDVSESESD